MKDMKTFERPRLSRFNFTPASGNEDIGLFTLYHILCRTVPYIFNFRLRAHAVDSVENYDASP